MFISIQFRDKVVLIVVYKSLNVQYPLSSNPGYIGSFYRDSIPTMINDTVDDFIEIKYLLWLFNGKYIGWFD